MRVRQQLCKMQLVRKVLCLQFLVIDSVHFLDLQDTRELVLCVENFVYPIRVAWDYIGGLESGVCSFDVVEGVVLVDSIVALVLVRWIRDNVLVSPNVGHNFFE